MRYTLPNKQTNTVFAYKAVVLWMPKIVEAKQEKLSVGFLEF